MTEAIASSAPLGKITHRTGRHCGSSAIRDLIEYHGTPLTEAMCFGLGAGLGITYLELPDSPIPFMTHVRSLGYEARVFENLGVPFAWSTYDSPDEATLALEELLDAGRPALLLTDIFHLPYFGSRTHFPGHAIMAWQRIPSAASVLVTDTDRPHTIPVERDALTRARFSSQLPFVHNGDLFAPKSIDPDVSPERIADAIRQNAALLLTNDPHSGLRALDTWISDLPRWETTGDWRWTTRFAYQVIEKRGTGGGGFREMYAEFLVDASRNDNRIRSHQLPTLMGECAQQWTRLATELKSSSESEYFPALKIANAIADVQSAEQRYIESALAY